MIPSPLPHQKRAILAVMDEESLLIEYGTGTGKSRIATDSIEALLAGGEIPILFIIPNSLFEQYEEEFVKWQGQAWTDRNVQFLSSTLTIYMRRQALKHGKSRIFVLATEALSYMLIREGIASRDWAAVFLDEASKFRNYSKRTVTFQMAGKRAASRYAMTGNLMVRAPTDVWYVTNWLRPGVWGTRDLKTFKSMYCVLGGYSGQQALTIRPEMVDKFKAVMDSLRIQCELSDVRDMPEREMIVRRVSMPIAQEKAYKQMRDKLLVEIERLTEPEFKSRATTYAVRLLRLQEIAAGFSRNTDGDVVHLPNPKTDELMDILEDGPDVPTVVWYWWRPELDIIRTGMAKHGFKPAIFGQPGAVASFMSGETNILISQLGRGGYGLNLTRATRMVYHSLPWDLDVYSQSQERNMRLTTTATYLEIIHLLVRNSVDGYVRDRLVNKAGISSTLSRSQALALLRGT